MRNHLPIILVGAAIVVGALIWSLWSTRDKTEYLPANERVSAPTSVPGGRPGATQTGRAIKFPGADKEETLPADAMILFDAKNSDTDRNEAASRLRRSNYPGLTGALIKVLNSPDEGARFRSFAVQHLWHQSKKAGPDELQRIRSTLHKALDDRHVPVRREALLALTRMKDSKAAETAAKWLAATGKDADAVRDLAIRCVHELDLREHLPAIRRYARDPDVVVRIAAIVALSQWGDEESKPVFQEAADSSVVRLQRAGKAALARLVR